MHSIKILFALLLAFSLCDATEKSPIPGPKGGKLLGNSAPRAEFFIEKDNRVTVTFYDDKLKPVPVSGQIVSIAAEPKTGKVKLELEKKNGALVSKEPLPKSRYFDEYQIIVEIRATADASPQRFNIRFDLDVCGKCKLREYACICQK